MVKFNTGMQYKVTYKYSVVREVEYASRAVAAQWMMNDVVWEANMETNITILWNLPVITEVLSPFICVKQKLPVYRSELTPFTTSRGPSCIIYI